MGDLGEEGRTRAQPVSVLVLGPVQLLAGGRSVALARRPQAIVAILAANANHPVSTARIAEELYPDSTAEDPTAVVRVHVSNLRADLRAHGSDPAILATERDGYLLRLPPGTTDADTFEARCAEARRAPDRHVALDAVESALTLWRGEPFGSAADLPSVRPEAARLASGLRAAQAHRAELLLELGRHHQVVGDLQALVARQPFDETFCSLLMLALYRCGRATEALACSQELRARLREEHGTGPGPTVERMEQAILVHDPVLDRAATAPVTGPAVVAPPQRGGGVDRAGPDASDPASVVAAMPDALLWWVQAAAVGGDAVAIDDVDAVVAGDARTDPVADAIGPSDGASAVAAAVAAGILAPEGSDVVRFASTDWRTAVLHTIDVFTRPRLHWRWAAHLARRGAPPDAATAILVAEHGDRSLGSGIASEVVVDWLVHAGDVASAAADHDEAVRWYERSLFAADQFGGRHRVDIQLVLGEARWAAGRVAEAARTFLDLVDAGRRAGDRLLTARAAAGAVGFRCVRDRLSFASSGSATAADLLEQALGELGPDDDAAAVGLLAPLAAVRAAQARPEEADRVSADAVLIAERTGDRRMLGQALAWRCVALLHVRYLDEREAAVERLTAVAEDDGADDLRHVALRHRVQCLVERDRLDEARRLMDPLVRCTAVLRQPVAARHTALLQTMFLLLDGRWDDARVQAGAELDTARRGVEPYFAVHIHLIQMAVIHYNRGDDRELRAIAALVLEHLGGADGAVGAPEWQPWQAVLCLIELWTGQVEPARRRLRRLAHDGFAAVPSDQVWIGNMAMLATAAAVLQERAVAEVLLDLLRPFADRRVTVPGVCSLAPTSHYLGILAATCGRTAAAESWLEHAVASCRRPGGSPYQEAQSLVHLAALVAGRGDERRAGELQAAAARAAQALDLGGLAHHVSDDRVP